MTEPIRSKQAIVDSNQPFDYEQLLKAKEQLVNRYPAISYELIGRSVMGRELGAFRIGNGPRALHYNGAMHANEWMTAMLLVQFLGELGESVAAGTSCRGQPVQEWLQHTTLWVVPMVNPDGVELCIHGAGADHPNREQLLEWNGMRDDFSGWKANIRGVDLNDQFPACWEIERDRRDTAGPGPRDFTGRAPLTEPEARALAKWTKLRDFDMVVAFHMQGREIYWNYRDLEPPESKTWAARFGDASGYLPIKLTGSDAGYKDWFIQDFGRPGFTVEAGFGVNPLPLSEYEEVYKETAPLMLEGLKGACK